MSSSLDEKLVVLTRKSYHRELDWSSDLLASHSGAISVPSTLDFGLAVVLRKKSHSIVSLLHPLCSVSLSELSAWNALVHPVLLSERAGPGCHSQVLVSNLSAGLQIYLL